MYRLLLIDSTLHLFYGLRIKSFDSKNLDVLSGGHMPITNAKRAIVSVSGTNLTKDECILFQKYPQLGFILFKRNIVDLEQVQGLIKQLKECIGRDDLLFLVDQLIKKVIVFQGSLYLIFLPHLVRDFLVLKQEKI